MWGLRQALLLLSLLPEMLGRTEVPLGGSLSNGIDWNDGRASSIWPLRGAASTPCLHNGCDGRPCPAADYAGAVSPPRGSFPVQFNAAGSTLDRLIRFAASQTLQLSWSEPG